MNRFFRVLFGQSGDRTTIPTPAEPGGSVSFAQGYGPDYERAESDPLRKNIERDKMNALFYDITAAIAELQSRGVPDFITSTLNGGTAYSYDARAVVRYSGDLYISLVAANTATPADTTKWALLPTPARIQTQAYISASAGGSVNALTLSLIPAATAWDGLFVAVRANGANTSTTPTLNIDGLGAKTIVRDANQPLRAGDIPGAGAWCLFKYDSTLGRVVLLNPATPSATGSAPIVHCRGMAVFTGITTASLLPSSVNASSVTRVAYGLYRIVFAEPMPSENYGIAGFASDYNNTGNPMVLQCWSTDEKTVNACVVRTTQGEGEQRDAPFVSVQFFHP